MEFEVMLVEILLKVDCGKSLEGEIRHVHGGLQALYCC